MKFDTNGTIAGIVWEIAAPLIAALGLMLGAGVMVAPWLVTHALGVTGMGATVLFVVQLVWLATPFMVGVYWDLQDGA